MFSRMSQPRSRKTCQLLQEATLLKRFAAESAVAVPPVTSASYRRGGEGLRLRAMRLVVFCLLASGLSPSMTQAQASAEVPVIEIKKEGSSIKFHVKASVASRFKQPV